MFFYVTYVHTSFKINKKNIFKNGSFKKVISENLQMVYIHTQTTDKYFKMNENCNRTKSHLSGKKIIYSC